MGIQFLRVIKHSWLEYNKNTYQIERANDFQIIKVAKFNQRISLQNFSINGTNSKSKEEIVKVK